MVKITKAIIPAAGYGTRNLPITKVVPKEMFPIAGKPAIHYIVDEAIASGIEEILIVVSRNKNIIMDYFDRSLEYESFLEKANKQHLLEKIAIPDVHIQYVRQSFAAGLGDAIKLGRHFAGTEPIAVMLPDDLFICTDTPALAQLVNSFHNTSRSTIALEQVKKENLKNYGVIKEEKITKELYKLLDIEEKPQSDPPSNLAVSGRYVLTPAIFTHLDKVKKGSGGEIQLTDAIKSLITEEDCFGVEIKGERFDLGSETEYMNLIKKMILDS